MKPDGALTFSCPPDLSEYAFIDACRIMEAPISVYTLHINQTDIKTADEIAKKLDNVLVRVNIIIDAPNRYEWWLERDGKIVWAQGP